MTDDPRAILKAAGVECAELDFLIDNDTADYAADYDIAAADAAILALARIVAKQRGMLELAYTDYEAHWNPDWGSFRQHDAWLSDLEADCA